MKIAKRLKLNYHILLFISLVVVLSLTWSFWETDRADQDEKMVLKMRNISFDRTVLRDDYLLYQEERAVIQWKVKSENLRILLENAVGRFTAAEDKALLQEARKNFDATFSGFSAIMEKHKRENRRSKTKLAFGEEESRLIGQVFLKSYALIDSLGRLHESAERAAIRAQNRLVFLIIFLFAIGGIFILANSVLLNRILAKRVKQLNEGVGIVGAGNLDYHIPLEGDDELTDLARASNKMVDKLKQSYTSIENLQREISGRKQAEEVSKKEQALSDAIIEAIPGTFYMLDETGQYVRWNAYQRDEIVGKPDDLVGSINALETIHPDDRGLIQSKIANVLANGADETVESRVLLRGGPASRWMVMTGCQMMIDGRPFLVGIGIDITERKQAEIQKDVALKEIKRLNAELEERVTERTSELAARTTELERINKAFVGRELRMRELKMRIAELEKK